MKKQPIFRALTAIALMLVLCMNGVAQTTTPATALYIGSQTGALKSGSEGTATFALNSNFTLTTPITGSVIWRSAASNSLPADAPSGVSTTLTLSVNGPNSLVVKTTTGTPAGTYYFWVKIGNKLSDNTGILVINPGTTIRNVGLATNANRDYQRRTDMIIHDVTTVNQIPDHIYYPQSVVINGVTWATCNVGSPGTFTENPGSSYVYYQFNSKRGWFLNSSFAEMDPNHPGGATWEAANDPCPDGWRVPTKEEFTSLIDPSKVNIVWSTWSSGTPATNGIQGIWITDRSNPNYPLFLPAAGRLRCYYEQPLVDVNEYGFYWSSTLRPDVHMASANLGFSALFLSPEDIIGSAIFTNGFPIRCVKK